MFGPEIYAAFVELKRLFDPTGLMNPWKVIDAHTMTDNLRYQTPGYAEHANTSQRAALYQYRDQGGLPLAIEQCNGVGACRKVGSGTMCPSYMATRDEQHSTRGRANALRLAMSGQLGNDPVAALASDGIDDCLSLCLACKACKTGLRMRSINLSISSSNLARVTVICKCLGPRWALSALCRPVCAAREPLRAQGCSVGGCACHRFWPGAQFLRAHVGSACGVLPLVCCAALLPRVWRCLRDQVCRIGPAPVCCALAASQVGC
jgi:hypothetical protein